LHEIEARAAVADQRAAAAERIAKLKSEEAAGHRRHREALEKLGAAEREAAEAERKAAETERATAAAIGEIQPPMPSAPAAQPAAEPVPEPARSSAARTAPPPSAAQPVPEPPAKPEPQAVAEPAASAQPQMAARPEPQAAPRAEPQAAPDEGPRQPAPVESRGKPARSGRAGGLRGALGRFAAGARMEEEATSRSPAPGAPPETTAPEPATEATSTAQQAPPETSARQPGTPEASTPQQAMPAPSTPPPAPSGASTEAPGLININTASLEDLRGAELSVTQATRVLAFRERRGRYSSVDDLDEVPGFPQEALAKLKQRVTV
jgi:competence ComEA-like helix-hairpin-helix protein